VATKQIKAKKVQHGDILPGLGGVYVFEVYPRGTFEVRIYFHNDNGDEGFVQIGQDQKVTVKR